MGGQELGTDLGIDERDGLADVVCGITGGGGCQWIFIQALLAKLGEGRIHDVETVHRSGDGDRMTAVPFPVMP